MSLKTRTSQSLRTSSEGQQQTQVLIVNLNLLVTKINIFIGLTLILNLLPLDKKLLHPGDTYFL